MVIKAVRAQPRHRGRAIVRSRLVRLEKGRFSASDAVIKTLERAKRKPSKRVVVERPSAPVAPGWDIVGSTAFAAGSAAKGDSKAQIRLAARKVRAQKELTQLAELRLIHRATAIKASQDSIATLLGTSQPTVSRLIKRIEQAPWLLEPSPREIINQRAVGQIDTETMLNTLVSYSYAPGSYDPTGGDGFLRGDWRQIEDALVSGLITDEEYERVAREAPAAKSERGLR